MFSGNLIDTSEFFFWAGKCHHFRKFLQFVRDYIKMDGVFVLKMLTIHSGILVCSEVVDAMWDNYLIEIGKKIFFKFRKFFGWEGELPFVENPKNPN
jgi:hypothetical protein